MQHELMIIHVLGFRRVVLQNAFLIIEEEGLDSAHLLPRWGSMQQGYRDMIPIAAIAGDDPHVLDFIVAA